LVFLDVNVVAGKTGRIGIHKGADPKMLAQKFAQAYSLNVTMKQALEKLIENYVNTYFADAK